MDSFIHDSIFDEITLFQSSFCNKFRINNIALSPIDILSYHRLLFDLHDKESEMIPNIKSINSVILSIGNILLISFGEQTDKIHSIQSKISMITCSSK